MKRTIAILLLAVLMIGCAMPASAAVSWQTAYYQYLYNEVYPEGTILNAGIVNLNKRGKPELIYSFKEGSNTTLHICGYEDGEVSEYELAYSDLFIKPTTMYLNEYKSRRSSMFSWALYVKSKSTSKRHEKSYYQLNLSGEDMSVKWLMRSSYVSTKNVTYYYNNNITSKTYFKQLKAAWFGNRIYIRRHPMYFMGKRTRKNFNKMFDRALAGYYARAK